MELPLVAPIRQILNQPVVADVAAEVRRQWQSSRLPKQLRRGDRVAVAVGSRGISNLATIALVPMGGFVLYFFRQVWASLTLSFANMTAYEDMQSTDYRDGARGLLPAGMMYRSPNGNFPRPVLIAFGAATIIMLLVAGNTSAAIPFYGIGVFAPEWLATISR